MLLPDTPLPSTSSSNVALGKVRSSIGWMTCAMSSLAGEPALTCHCWESWFTRYSHDRPAACHGVRHPPRQRCSPATRSTTRLDEGSTDIGSLIPDGRRVRGSIVERPACCRWGAVGGAAYRRRRPRRPGFLNLPDLTTTKFQSPIPSPWDDVPRPLNRGVERSSIQERRPCAAGRRTTPCASPGRKRIFRSRSAVTEIELGEIDERFLSGMPGVTQCCRRSGARTGDGRRAEPSGRATTSPKPGPISDALFGNNSRRKLPDLYDPPRALVSGWTSFRAKSVASSIVNALPSPQLSATREVVPPRGRAGDGSPRRGWRRYSAGGFPAAIGVHDDFFPAGRQQYPVDPASRAG